MRVLIGKRCTNGLLLDVPSSRKSRPKDSSTVIHYISWLFASSQRDVLCPPSHPTDFPVSKRGIEPGTGTSVRLKFWRAGFPPSLFHSNLYKTWSLQKHTTNINKQVELWPRQKQRPSWAACTLSLQPPIPRDTWWMAQSATDSRPTRLHPLVEIFRSAKSIHLVVQILRRGKVGWCFFLSSHKMTPMLVKSFHWESSTSAIPLRRSSWPG